MKKNLVKKVTLSVLAAFVGMGVGYGNIAFAGNLELNSLGEIDQGNKLYQSFMAVTYEAKKNNNVIGKIDVMSDSNITISGYKIYLNDRSSNEITINVNDDFCSGENTNDIRYLASIYGGYIEDTNENNISMNDNTLIINGNNKELNIGELAGGKSFDNSSEMAGEVNNNKLFIKNITFLDSNEYYEPQENYFYGGTALQNIDTTNNTVEIENVKFKADDNKIYGGNSQFGEVKQNKVNIKDSQIDGNVDIYGGDSGGSITENNTVEITDSTFNNKTNIYAARNSMSSSENNSLKINNITFNGETNIYGGYISNTDYPRPEDYGNAIGNKVILEGNINSGQYNDSEINIYGGFINYRVLASVDNIGEIKNNEVILKNAQNFENDNVNLYGFDVEKLDYAEINVDDEAHQGKFVNNNLIVNNWTGKVNSINNFSNVNFENLTFDSSLAQVIDLNKQADLSKTGIGVTFAGGQEFEKGSSMTLINNADGYKGSEFGNEVNTAAGVAQVVTGDITNENNKVVLTIDDVKLADQTKLVAENRAVAAAFINQGTDLIADSLDTISRDGKYGIKTFAAVHGNRSKYDVNSDIKINGWSTIVGVGSENEHNGGDFSWGVFYENGSGNYRTFNEFNNEFFRGDGSLVYNGGGIAARYENAHGVYTEGSLRAGMLKSEMTDALSDGNQKYGYKSESEYYGAHIGIGQIIPLSESSDLDVYGKFFHTYTEGDSFNVAGDEFEFDSINSDRLRIGARLTTNKENKFSTYYGLAYEYEFNGDAEMRAAGMDAPTQSLQGSSYMAEIGLNYQPTPDSPWSFDLNMRGYAGEREGATFNVQATYTF